MPLHAGLGLTEMVGQAQRLRSHSNSVVSGGVGRGVDGRAADVARRRLNDVGKDLTAIRRTVAERSWS